LSGVRSVRLGQLLDPAYPIENDEQATGTSAADAEPPVLFGAPAAIGTPVSDAEPSNDQSAAPPMVVETKAPPMATVAELRPATKPAEIPMRGRGASTPKVLAVFNHKGGTGKTTTAVHVAAGLAARGAKVLLVDADGQGNVAASLGLEAEASAVQTMLSLGGASINLA